MPVNRQYIKQKTFELGALAGFERSGHYFFNNPIGRGYDDACLSAIEVCKLLDGNPKTGMSHVSQGQSGGGGEFVELEILQSGIALYVFHSMQCILLFSLHHIL